MNNLNAKALGGLLFLLLVMAALLFLPAGTLDYWQAWAFLAVFGVLLAGNHALPYEKRPETPGSEAVQAGPTAEKEWSQKIIQSISTVMFIAMLVVPALDHRFAWSPVPDVCIPGG